MLPFSLCLTLYVTSASGTARERNGTRGPAKPKADGTNWLMAGCNAMSFVCPVMFAWLHDAAQLMQHDRQQGAASVPLLIGARTGWRHSTTLPLSPLVLLPALTLCQLVGECAGCQLLQLHTRPHALLYTKCQDLTHCQHTDAQGAQHLTSRAASIRPGEGMLRGGTESSARGMP